MDWAIVVILQVMFQPCLSVLFTVEAEQTMYTSEFGQDVVMGCRFQPKLSSPHDSLKVTWQRTTPESTREVYHMANSVEDLSSQDPDYQGRVKLLKEKLSEGLAKIQVSRLRINDSGTYTCVVQTEKGFDYKTIKLSVVAPYKAVTKHIQKTGEGDEVLLTCRSEGYPKSDVIWKDRHQTQVNSNSTVKTRDELFDVTSEIRIRSSDKNNYTCTFTDKGPSATFHIPDEMPTARANNDALFVALSIGVIMLVIIAVVLMYRRRKGSSTPNTGMSLVNGRNRAAAASECLQVNKENEEERTSFNEGCNEENLEAVVKAHYSDVSFSAEAKPHLDAFDAEELSQRLQNNEGKPVNLQALVPGPGETLLLEGPLGSGKTTAAHILVSSWSEGSTRWLDVSALELLVYVDCSGVKGDLLQETVTQLSRTEKISAEDELRTLLTGSSATLLLLDGYSEGNPCFDESLKKFLSERRGCRVLVTACPGDCPSLRDTVGTRGVLELQRRTVKY